ncbi:acyl-CoA dehydrogenase family protein [Pacificispira sp.]|uniref:acyl-CoA dehydrogenase family protein n=1 Tax=Pacificispira sp. TaxID=2888761 RepID=UPI003B51C56B
MTETEPDLTEFEHEFSLWLESNKPEDPGYRLPETFMEVSTDAQFHFLSAWQKKVAAAGFIGVSWPRDYGGRGLPQDFQRVVDSELRRQRAPIVMNTIGLNWAGPLILDIGSETQKRKFAERILTGEDIWCQGFSEPGAGSDLANISTRAVRDGKGWRVNGSKIWTTLANYADYMILLTQGEGRNARYKGMNFFLMPMDLSGVEIQPIRKMTGEYGFCQVFLNDVYLPEDCLIGAEGDGWQVAMRTLTYERQVAGGQGCGHGGNFMVGAHLVDAARKSRYGGIPALKDPIIRDKLVDILIEEQANLLSDERMKVPALIGDHPETIPLSKKLRLSEWRQRAQRLGVELQGLDGALYLGDPDALEDGAWQRGYFNTFASTIGGGPSQIQRNIIGERALGLARDRKDV